MVAYALPKHQLWTVLTIGLKTFLRFKIFHLRHFYYMSTYHVPLYRVLEIYILGYRQLEH
jgi:hypothetical protein